MFDNNGHEPILSQMEIRFLLSDQPVHTKNTARPAPGKTPKTAKNVQKEKIADPLFDAPREPRQT